MTTPCGTVREALSAHIDGEEHELSIEQVDGHVLACDGCTRFAAGLPLLDERVAAFRAVPVLDGTADVLAAAGAQRLAGARGSRRSTSELRGLLGLAAAVQLILAVVSLSGGLGSHVARDLALFQLAAAGGLGAAAWRPVLAAGLLPMIALAAGAGLVTMGIDVMSANASLGNELPHLVLVVAVWPLLALARRQGVTGTVPAL